MRWTKRGASLQLFALAHAVVVAAGGADKSSVQPAFSAPLHGLGFARKHAMRRVQVNGGSTDKGSVRERPVQRRFCQQLQAVAREEWSITGGNTALQSLMGTGAGVATEDVCTLRHDKEGTGIELWHGSFGWFDFMAYDGAPVILSDTWGIQIERPTQVFPSGGKQYSTLRRAAQNGDQAFRPPSDVAIKAGTWTVTAQGDYLLVTNQYASRQSLVLTDEGFVFLGSRGTSLAVLKGQQAQEMPRTEALKLVPGVVLQ